ncbi:GIY-YIG nuclease family protein [Dasania marina]|uniref:GIY-YIG nuclease family protein n=1 Tax=Dasania marina TaxID=471499 RepID=UPI0030D7C128
MIIYTITNTITQQIYVGSTRECAYERWKQYLAAHNKDIDAALYRDMRQHGAENFSINESGFAYDMDEAREMVADTIATMDAINLQGMKTSAPALKAVISKKTTSVTRKAKPANSSSARSEKPKIATGRTGSSSKEKKIRDAIEQEKADRQEQRYRQIAAEADEMKAIMAKLDARTSGPAKRSR